MKLNRTMIMAGLIAGSLFAANLAVQAQDATTTNTPPPKAHTPGAGRGFEQLASQLGLTDDQKEKVRPILQQMNQKNAELRKDTTMSPADRRAKMKENHDAASAQLKEVLTPAQYEQWQHMGHRAHPAGGAGTPPPAGAGTPPAAGTPPQQ